MIGDSQIEHLRRKSNIDTDSKTEVMFRCFIRDIDQINYDFETGKVEFLNK